MNANEIKTADRRELADELAAAGEYTEDWSTAEMDDLRERVESMTTTYNQIADHDVEHDASGVGHCWQTAIDLPADIEEEVACWIIEDEPKPGDEYTATNGQTYRLPPE